jgi:hypothetical protein
MVAEGEAKGVVGRRLAVIVDEAHSWPRCDRQSGRGLAVGGLGVGLSSLLGYVRAMSRPEGFRYTVHGDEIVITHRGITATVLRGAKARAFLDDIETQDPQELMARLTGNYRRGNERQARQHPRNRGR